MKRTCVHVLSGWSLILYCIKVYWEAKKEHSGKYISQRYTYWNRRHVWQAVVKLYGSQAACSYVHWSTVHEQQDSGEKAGVSKEIVGTRNVKTVESLCSNMSSMCLVKECKKLEEFCGVAYVDRRFDMEHIAAEVDNWVTWVRLSMRHCPEL